MLLVHDLLSDVVTSRGSDVAEAALGLLAGTLVSSYDEIIKVLFCGCSMNLS